MTTQAEPRSLLTEGVFLAAVSAFVYFIAFVYEYGYCLHFGIPAALISPNASTFLVAAFTLGVTLLPALNFLAFTTPLFKAARDPERRPYRDVYSFLAVFSAAGILLGAIYGVSPRGIAVYVGATVAFMAFLFLPAMLSNRNLPFAERLAKHADLQDQDPFVPTNLFEGWLSRRHLQLALLALITLLVAHLVGDAEAQGRRQFLALKSDPDMVLLRSYGDLLIMARVSKSGANLTDDVRLLWLSEKKELDLVFRKVGPIQKSSSLHASAARAPMATAPDSKPSATPSAASAPASLPEGNAGASITR